MRTVYRALASLIALGVLFQAAVLAFGTFTVWHEVDRGATITASYDFNTGQELHGLGGVMIIPILTLLLLIVSFFAKVKGGIKWALLVLLVVFVQVNLGFFAFDTPVLGLLHGANAFVLFAVAVLAARAAGRPSVTDTPAAAGTAPVGVATEAP